MNMPEIKFKKEKCTVKESGFKVGDILVGKTHMYHTVTHWYQITKVTEKQMEMMKLPVSYETKYMSNTPGSECMPILRINGQVYVAPICSYYPRANFDEIVKGKTIMLHTLEDEKIVDTESVVEILGDKYAPFLRLWDGKPGWVNCM